ncbi:DUF1287 domain-containing protein [Heliomicrobium undosum]
MPVPHARGARRNLLVSLIVILSLGIGSLTWLRFTYPELTLRLNGAINEIWSSKLGMPGLPLAQSISVPLRLSGRDQDGDGVDDSLDIVAGGRAEVQRRPAYRSAYYAGGYPPSTEGVCTDVIWRSFQEAGYDLKAMIDDDIAKNGKVYPRVGGRPDPNIDFRRVPNLVNYFQRHGQSLTTTLIPGDLENLAQWQPGDIVVFGLGRPQEHIGIITDRRRSDGVPLVIHNGGPNPREENALVTWPAPIDYHFRFQP